MKFYGYCHIIHEAGGNIKKILALDSQVQVDTLIRVYNLKDGVKRYCGKAGELWIFCEQYGLTYKCINLSGSLEERIIQLEKDQSIPGTIIQRTLHKDKGVEWTIGIGGMNAPKSFYSGVTLEEAVCKAEEEYFNF